MGSTSSPGPTPASILLRASSGWKLALVVAFGVFARFILLPFGRTGRSGGLVRTAAATEALAPWARAALEAVFHRLDGTRDSEWRHLVEARDGSDDVAVHVRMAQLRRGLGDELEVPALAAAVELAPLWLDGWLRLIVAQMRIGDELGAHRALE